MHIAGGIYQELCCRPTWNAKFGSGARAAMAISSLSPASTLHSYFEEGGSLDTLNALKALSLKLQISQRPTGIAFSYFHPLSRPYISPPRHEISPLPGIFVKGDVVLRFGFLEGEAVVDANYAVYDPQTSQNPAPFGGNGSRTKMLAIVLNELELRSSTGLEDVQQASQKILKDQMADVVVLKRGIRGATVFERTGLETSIPAYRSSHVFKIGTGDVFSAVFAHFWAEKKLSPGKAADLASRFVAVYCENKVLPVRELDTQCLKPIKCGHVGLILLLGAIDCIGQLYTMEEARFVLKELGINVCCPALKDKIIGPADAILLLADGVEPSNLGFMEQEWFNDTPIVVFKEKSVACSSLLRIEQLAFASITDDFATALYFAAWSASVINE